MLLNYGAGVQDASAMKDRVVMPRIKTKPLMDRPRLLSGTLHVPSGIVGIEKLMHTIQALMNGRRSTGPSAIGVMSTTPKETWPS